MAKRTLLGTAIAVPDGIRAALKELMGKPTSEAALADRVAILQQAKAEVFGAQTVFDGCWTYIAGRRAG